MHWHAVCCYFDHRLASASSVLRPALCVQVHKNIATTQPGQVDFSILPRPAAASASVPRYFIAVKCKCVACAQALACIQKQAVAQPANCNARIERCLVGQETSKQGQQ